MIGNLEFYRSKKKDLETKSRKETSTGLDKNSTKSNSPKVESEKFEIDLDKYSSFNMKIVSF